MLWLLLPLLLLLLHCSHGKRLRMLLRHLRLPVVLLIVLLLLLLRLQGCPYCAAFQQQQAFGCFCQWLGALLNSEPWCRAACAPTLCRR